MARPGVTYQEVVEAANQLVGQQHNPTIEKIRLIIGSGSSTTIAAHLKEWKARQDETDQIAAKENLPSEFIALMKGLWQRLLGEADQRVTLIKTELTNILEETRAKLSTIQQDHTHLQQQHEQLKQQKESLSHNKTTLEQIRSEQQQEILSLNGKINGLNEQIQEKQARIEELAKLHKQVQDNLEHYREAVREQRLQDQERHTQQQQQAELTVKSLQQELMNAAQEKLRFQYQIEKALHEKELTEKAQQDSLLKLDQLKTEAISQKNLLLEKSQLAQQLQFQLDLREKQVLDQQTSLSHLQKESAALSARIVTIESECVVLKEQNTQLAREKWDASQEKAHLEGQLKQLQEILARSKK
jgi:hypothetical protein